MKLTGKISSIDLDFVTRKPKLTIEINGQYDLLTEEINDLQRCDEIRIELKKATKKRSLDANAYCWTLIGKIAQELRSTKEEVYKELISYCGIYRVVTIAENAVDTFVKVWGDRGLGWICERSAREDGFIDVTAYYGTSSYNTKQMANFIDHVIDEAKSLGIETLTPAEIERLKGLWGTETI